MGRGNNGVSGLGTSSVGEREEEVESGISQFLVVVGKMAE